MARSEVNYIYDAATALRARGSAAVTAAGVVGTVKLDKLDKVPTNSRRNQLGAQSYTLVIHVTAAVTAGSEEYNFTVQTGATGAASVEVASLKTVGALGQYVIEIDAATIEKLDADHEELELNLGFKTTPSTAESITFSAWLV